MGTSILYQNFITSASMLSASSYAAAILSGITRTQGGSVVFEVQGTYSGVLDSDYVVQLQAAGPNGDFAGTTYRWSSDGGTTWAQENLTPLGNTWVPLNNNVEARFVPGPSLPYFTTGDVWQFRAIRKYGLDKLIDLSRDTELRSGTIADGATWDIVANLGSSQMPLALVLFDHNCLQSGTIQFQESTTSDFAAFVLNVTVPWQSQKICYFPPSPQSGQFCRVRFTAGAGQSEFHLAELYIGGRTIFTPGFRSGYSHSLLHVGGRQDIGVLAYGQGAATLMVPQHSFVMGHRRPADVVKLKAIATALNDWSNGDLQPCFVVPNDADLTTFDLEHWLNGYEAQNLTDGVDDIRMELLGVGRSL